MSRPPPAAYPPPARVPTMRRRGPPPDGGPDPPGRGRPLPSSAAPPPPTERELMAMYGLDSMYPEVWTEPEPEAGPDGAASSNGNLAASGQSMAASSNNGSQLWPTTDPDDLIDPLGLVPSIRRQVSGDVPLEAITLTSKNFDPKRFLAVVHSTAPFDALDEGLRRLEHAGERQTEIMHSLVRGHFDDFIMAKATVDDVYHTMTSRHLDPATQFGTDALGETLAIAATTASQVFQPILTRRARADAIRSTLIVLERYKFFVNLPATVHTAIQTNRLDAAVRDYRKGQALLATLNTSSTSRQLRHLFDRVWAEVDRVMASVRDRLFRQLNDHAVPVADQDLAMTLMLEMDPASDPVSYYLESRSKWIIGQLREKVGLHYRSLPEASALGVVREFSAAQMRRAVQLRNKKDFHSIFASDPEVQLWHDTTALIQSLAQTLTATLPDFWKVSKGYMEGKYIPKDATVAGAKSKGGPNRRAGAIGGGAGGGAGGIDLSKVEQGHTLVAAIIEYFGNVISQALGTADPIRASPSRPVVDAAGADGTPPNLSITIPDGGRESPVVPSASPIVGGNASLPPLPPLTYVNAVTVAAYAPQIVAHLHGCCAQVKALKVQPAAMEAMAGVVEKVQGRLLEGFLGAWTKETRLLPKWEDWTLPPDPTGGANTSSNGTVCTAAVTQLHQHTTRWMLPASARLAARAPPGVAPNPTAVTARWSSMAALHWAQAFTNWLEEARSAVMADGGDAEHRALVTLCNLDAMRRVVVPTVATSLETALGGRTMDAERRRVDEQLAQLETQVVDQVVARVRRDVEDAVQRGVRADGVSWRECPKPIGVQPWVYTILMVLVRLQAAAAATHPRLIPRLLPPAIATTANAVLTALRQVEAFSSMGARQANLDVAFLRATCPTAEATWNVALDAIRAASSDAAEAGPGAIRNLLENALEGTKTQFASLQAVVALPNAAAAAAPAPPSQPARGLGSPVSVGTTRRGGVGPF